MSRENYYPWEHLGYTLNESRVIQALVNGDTTQYEIAATTKLPQPTVSIALRRLAERNVVKAENTSTGGVGRPLKVYTLDNKLLKSQTKTTITELRGVVKCL